MIDDYIGFAIAVCVSFLLGMIISAIVVDQADNVCNELNFYHPEIKILSCPSKN